jgi:hypothetical protein
MGKNKILIAVSAITAVLVISALYSLITIKSLNAKIKKLNAQRDKELRAGIDKEMEFVRQDMQEKYAADMVSYQAMAKRLEIEKKKAAELENQLKTAQSKQAKK